MANQEDADFGPRSLSRSASRSPSGRRSSGGSAADADRSEGWRAQREASARPPPAILRPGKGAL
eukprot:2106856-Alexandrium_andersonii.AAC.1